MGINYNISMTYFVLARGRSSVGTHSLLDCDLESLGTYVRPSRRTCSFIYKLTAVSSSTVRTLTNETG